MSTPFLDPSGNSISEDQLLGYGRSGVVILKDNAAIKLPLRYLSTSDDEVLDNITVIQREQNVYQHLGHCTRVVPYISFSEKTTHLAFMENGDLRSYLSRNKQPPSKSLQLSWFRQMALALSHIHHRSVIVADIACRNILLDSDLSIKFCDFTEATIMPPDSDLETVDDNGYSIQTDIGQLGKVIYEVVTGKKCLFDLHENNISRATLPRRETLPTTHDIWLGHIIEKCWIPGTYRNATDLLKELNTISLNDINSNSKYQPPE
ncbi:serine/threonine protein kinase [Aspergillus sclerotioniger CBS 115572]|uniref:Serine/threonine protein kinase n=1 Tax=Aspergillus sclerotioniger CBS 115572 TaxID=1450535 RepID=A0A317VDY7_9EURO|nr:serine/threonine protein kinase [Aspergillus sclerotioniger CBS 115572]PWY72165.1 serine/threonine protein kinase [Aspergillus sclerotioniger CBS 115572]